MVVPGATRVGGGNGAAGSIANLDDEGGTAVDAAAATSTSTSSSSFLSRLSRPPPPRVLLSEASGAVGDLGTFLPLTLGLVAAVGLDFGTALLFTGIYNVASGLAFGVPMPVQPMKTIAAVAVAASSQSSAAAKNPITLEEVMAAGMFVSAVVLFLGLTRLVDVVNRIVPRSVVAGLQLGVGLKLAASGVQSVFRKKTTRGWRAAGGVEGWALGAAALVFLFVSTVAPSRSKRGEEQEQGERNSSPSSSLLSLPPSPSSPSLLLLPRRLQEALLERKRRKQRRDDESESSSSIGGGSSSSGASAEPSLPLASPAADASAAAAEGGGGGEQTDPTNSPPPHPPPSSSSSWQVPSALLVSALGVALAFASAPAAARAALRLGPSRVVAAAPTLQDWANGITRAGGLAQLPLTTLNSVIAVSHLADSLYGGGESGRGGGAGGGSGNAAAAGGNGGSEGGGGGSSSSSSAPSPLLHHHRDRTQKRDKARWKPSRVAVAVGLYNLLGGWFGAVPACMGSGGLAAQHKFGARGGSAPILLGTLKISLALALGSSLSSILRFFPSGLLGAMLALAGAELAAAARAGGGGGGGCGGSSGGNGTAAAGSESNSSALSSPRFFAFAALTAAAILGLDDPAAGFAVGWGLWLSTEAWERGAGFLKRAWREKRRRKTDEKGGPASGKSEV